jgi:predicted ribosome quality control (RQC) complex YloA/Tae2 family protein
MVKQPLLDVDMEISKAQRMFEDKKARRERRRSLRDSADFLGVQGANPRTGYWDVSTGTSSSEPSQMSDETKRKLDQEAKDIEEKKGKWEEAQSKLEAELKRVQAIKDQKRKEKIEQKKLKVELKQRRHGKWRLSEDGWSSVAEPELSPIIQSLTGSPTRG